MRGVIEDLLHDFSSKQKKKLNSTFKNEGMNPYWKQEVKELISHVESKYLLGVQK